MSIKAALLQYLTSNAQIASAVGQRVYAEILPQKPTLPAVTYRRASAQRSKTLSCGTDSLVRSGFEISAWAKGYEQAEAVAEAVRRALVDFTGTWGGSPGIRIHDAALDGDLDLVDVEPGLYRVAMFYTISHVDTI